MSCAVSFCERLYLRTSTKQSSSSINFGNKCRVALVCSFLLAALSYVSWVTTLLPNLILSNQSFYLDLLLRLAAALSFDSGSMGFDIFEL